MNLYSMKLGIRNVRKTFRILKCDFYNRLHSIKLSAMEIVTFLFNFGWRWHRLVFHFNSVFFSFFFFFAESINAITIMYIVGRRRMKGRSVYRTRIRTSSFVIWIVVTFIGDFNPRPLNFHFWTKHVGETLWSNYRVKFISQVSGFTL